jgi:cation:H+ antiporter
MAGLWIVLGLVLLTVGAEVLVRGAARLAAAMGMPALIIGLTVVAYGTSAPELAVSINAAVSGQADIAMGNVVGSNTFNVLFILGLSAIIAPLIVSAQLVRLDVPLMIAVSGATWMLALDGRIDRGDGVGLAIAAAAYTALLIYIGRREPDAPSADQLPATNETAQPPKSGKTLAMSAVLIAAGLALLLVGANRLVHGAVEVARMLGVSELMIGLTIIAAGTSMPEVATSLIAALRGQRDIAVGNIVGSNIFNLLMVLGVTAAVSPSGVAVAPEAMRFDLPIMLAVALVCLPIFFTAGRIDRWEGVLLLGFYIAYVVFLILAAIDHAVLGVYTTAMLWFAIPLALLGIGVSVWIWLRRRS